MQDGKLRLMLHSFPQVSVMTKSQGYLRFWVQRPKQGLGNIFPEAKVKDLTIEAKDTIGWPRGQDHVLEDSNSGKL